MKNKEQNKEIIMAIRKKYPETNKNILNAFEKIDRKYFIEKAAYLDIPIESTFGQTISQPSLIAKMIFMLDISKGKDILEIGTNTGYHATIAAYLSYPGITRTIEIFPELAIKAKSNIENLIRGLSKKESKNLKKLKIYSGDGFDKKTEIWKFKYDVIYFTASLDGLQEKEAKEMAMKLLKENGKLLYPSREQGNLGSLYLFEFKNKKLKLIKNDILVNFVPLINKEQANSIRNKFNRGYITKIK